MNKLKIFFFLLLGSIHYMSYEQSVPQGISYQAIARDATGQILENTTVNLTVGILQNNNLVWEELHSLTTNQFGLITTTIGNGVSTGNGLLGGFDEILWFDGDYSGQFGIEVNGGDFIDLGTTLFLTVPYAFHAQTVEDKNDADADPINELIDSAVLDSDILTITENGIDHVVDFSSLSQDDDWVTNGNTVYNNTSKIGVGTDSPTSTFHANESVSYHITPIDENNSGMTLNETQHIIIGNVTNNSIVINLPDATTCEGREYIVKAFSSAGGNEIILNAQIGQTIDVFSNSINLSGNSMDYVTIISDGANWWIIGNN